MAVQDHVMAVTVTPPEAAGALAAALAALDGEAPFTQQQEQQIGEEMYIMRWLRPSSPAVAVDLTYDASVPMLMASVLSDSHGDVSAVSSALLHHMGGLVDSPEQARDAAEAAPTDPSLLVRAAVALAQRFDGKLFALIDAALRGEEPELRQAAAKAAALVKYAELIPALRRAVSAETDEATARMLGLALAKCEEGG